MYWVLYYNVFFEIYLCRGRTKRGLSNIVKNYDCFVTGIDVADVITGLAGTLRLDMHS
jgi:hypothetical protein